MWCLAWSVLKYINCIVGRKTMCLDWDLDWHEILVWFSYPPSLPHLKPSCVSHCYGCARVFQIHTCLYFAFVPPSAYFNFDHIHVVLCIIYSTILYC